RETRRALVAQSGRAREDRAVDGGAAQSAERVHVLVRALRARSADGRALAVPHAAGGPHVRDGPRNAARERHSRRRGAVRPLPVTKALTDYVVFNDQKLARKYSRAR